MARRMICLDTSVLIDYFRKENKENSLLVRLTDRYDSFATSVITEYEIYVGCNDQQLVFWTDFFENTVTLPFTSSTSRLAAKIYQELKRNNQLISAPDILIAATALEHDLPLATLNNNHFERIDNLRLVSR